MPFLRLERIDETCVAWMDGPRANAIGPAAVREFDLLLAAMRTDPSARAIVIASAHPRAFSSGFDIGEVFALDRETMRAFFTDFVRLLAAIRRYPKPIVAAIAQPAVAAGGLLAIACDARVFAPAGAALSIKAADLGVVLPRPLVEMVTAAAGLVKAAARRSGNDPAPASPRLRPCSRALCRSAHRRPGPGASLSLKTAARLRRLERDARPRRRCIGCGDRSLPRSMVRG